MVTAATAIYMLAIHESCRGGIVYEDGVSFLNGWGGGEVGFVILYSLLTLCVH